MAAVKYFFRTANSRHSCNLRYWLGECPNRFRKEEQNDPKLSSPTRKQMFVTGSSVRINNVPQLLDGAVAKIAWAFDERAP